MRNIFVVLGSAFLIISGVDDMSTRSKASSSWGYEKSFAALTVRSIGGLKIGLGLFALSALKISSEISTATSASMSSSKEDEIWETLMNLLSEKNRALADKSKSVFFPNTT